MAKSKVILQGTAQHKEWKDGQEGVIDGYVRGADDTPLAVVISGDRFLLVPISALKFVGYGKE